MRFGIFDHVERRQDMDLAQQYEERLLLAEQADEAGFYSYHVAEHHHSPLCLAPNQSVFFAAVAARTRRLRFGPLVSVLPLHNPVRLIEEICMVDQLSQGRYDVGVGAGTGDGTEFAMWGGDPSDNRARFEESLQVLRTGLQHEFLDHHGQFFDYHDVWMALRPHQRPHPPFWYAGNPQSAAQRGMNFIGAGTIEGFATAAAKFKEVWAEGSNGFARPDEPLYGAMKKIFIADTDEAARTRATAAYEVYRGNFAKPSSPSTDGDAAARSEASLRSIEAREAANHVAFDGGPATLGPAKAMQYEVLIAGSPATVADYVRRYEEGSGANYFVASFQWGDVTHDEAWHSMQEFANAVMAGA